METGPASSHLGPPPPTAALPLLPLHIPFPSAHPLPPQPVAHSESWKQGLCELGFEGVQELFGAGIVERQEAWGEGGRGAGVRTGVRTGEELGHWG